MLKSDDIIMKVNGTAVIEDEIGMTEVKSQMKMLTSVIFQFFLTLALLGCGGGSNSSSSPSIDVPESLEYQGNDDLVKISFDNVPELLGVVFSSLYVSDYSMVGSENKQISENDVPRHLLPEKLMTPGRALSRSMHIQNKSLARVEVEEVDEDVACENDEGRQIVQGIFRSDGTSDITFQFTNCLLFSEYLDGVINITVNRADVGEPGFEIRLLDTIFYFRSYRTSTTSYNITFDGELRLTSNPSDRIDRYEVNRLLIRDHLLGEDLFIEEQQSVVDYRNNTSGRLIHETSSGRLFHSVHGVINYQTLTPLVFSARDPELPEEGELIISGIDNDQLKVNFYSAASDIFDPRNLLDFEIDVTGDSNIDQLIVVNRDEFSLGLDLRDTDQDGMHNSWEIMYGLDIDNENDAGLDTDGDRFSNILEYISITDPLDPDFYPRSADLEIEITNVFIPIVGINSYYQIAIKSLDTDDRFVINPEVSFTLSPGTTIKHLPDIVSSWECVEENDVINCKKEGHLEEYTQGAELIFVYIQNPEIPGTISISATVTSETIDLNESNNTANLEIDLVPRSTDLVPNTKSVSGSAIVGTEFVQYLYVDNFGPHPTSDEVVIELTLPDGFVFLTENIPIFLDCLQVVQLIRCKSDHIRGGGSQIIPVYLRSPESPGVYPFDFQVLDDSEKSDINLDNNIVTYSLNVGQSMSVLQSQIDNALPNDTVVIDPGIYVGELDLSAREVNIVSKEGPESTILRSLESYVVQLGPNSRIEGFTIGGGVRGEFIGGILVTGDGSVIRGNIFEDNASQTGRVISGSNSSPTIENNIFRSNYCGNTNFFGGLPTLGSLILLYRNSSPLIQNNVFYDNECIGIAFQFDNEGVPVVVNNTLVNNSVGISYSEERASDSHIYRNNIMVNNGIGLEILDETGMEKLLWENNLLYNNGINYSGWVDQTFVNGNVNIAPLFVNQMSGDFKLVAGSPAIDSGSSVNAPLYDFDQTPRPLEGNDDGVAEFDMGAYEAE